MLKRLFQAATITFLLNLLAHTSSQDSTQQAGVSTSREVPKLVMSFR
jgi:hypothetical protein